jgi:sarcosine oxidase
MTKHFDVIVVGVGSMGAAACYRLALRGAKVLGLEQANIPHAGGSHHGGSRMIRQAYFEHPDYVALLKAVYPLWHALEAEVGETLFHQIGALYLGHPDCELLSGSRRAAQAYQVPHELLSATDVNTRFPAFRCPENWVGFFEPLAGYLRPEASVSAMARRALELGVKLCGQAKVVSWTSRHNRVEVRTTHEQFTAERLVLCGGAWAGRLLPGIPVALQVTRQVVVWVWPERREPFQSACLPCWAIDPEPAGRYRGIYYGFPLSLDPPGVKLGWHAPGLTTNPDRVDREIHPADLEWLPDFINRYMPELGGSSSDLPDSRQPELKTPGPSSGWLGASTCLYTYSPDGHFIVDRHPDFENVCFAAGFSGHGFKFAPIIGQALADLSLDGSTPLPIDFLRLARRLPPVS